MVFHPTKTNYFPKNILRDSFDAMLKEFAAWKEKQILILKMKGTKKKLFRIEVKLEA